MKLGDLLKLHKYKIGENLDENLMKFILNLKISQDDFKKIEVKPKPIKPKVTFLDKFCEYKEGDAERDFIIDILENNPKYRSYKYRYLDNLNLNIYDYTDEDIEEIVDPDGLDINIIKNGEVDELYVIDGITDINKMIEIFKEKLLPPIDIDAVYEEFSDIFEKVVGETRGFLKGLDGTWYKFGDDAERDCELLCIKYPALGEAMQNENLRNYFIDYLNDGADECLYIYNEKEIIKGWY